VTPVAFNEQAMQAVIRHAVDGSAVDTGYIELPFGEPLFMQDQDRYWTDIVRDGGVPVDLALYAPDDVEGLNSAAEIFNSDYMMTVGITAPWYNAVNPAVVALAVPAFMAVAETVLPSLPGLVGIEARLKRAIPGGTLQERIDLAYYERVVKSLAIPVMDAAAQYTLDGIAGSINSNDIPVQQPLPSAARLGWWTALGALLAAPFLWFTYNNVRDYWLANEPSPVLVATNEGIAGLDETPSYVRLIEEHTGDYTTEFDERVKVEQVHSLAEPGHSVLIVRNAMDKGAFFDAAQPLAVQRSQQRGVSGVLVALAGLYAGWQVGGTTGMLLGAAFLGLGAWTYM
jgi:hypothetical protein